MVIRNTISTQRASEFIVFNQTWRSQAMAIPGSAVSGQFKARLTLFSDALSSRPTPVFGNLSFLTPSRSVAGLNTASARAIRVTEQRATRSPHRPVNAPRDEKFAHRRTPIVEYVETLSLTSYGMVGKICNKANDTSTPLSREFLLYTVANPKLLLSGTGSVTCKVS
jgi:hypothetical protein